MDDSEKELGKMLLLEDIIRAVWVKKVHVTNSGYFSDCPRWCDCCTWKEHFDVHSVPDLEALKPLCDTFEVKSWKKTYTYYVPTDAAIDFLMTHHEDKILQHKEEYHRMKNSNMVASRVLVNHVGKRLVYGMDYSEVDHGMGATREVCFHKPKHLTLEVYYILYIEYEREKNIEGLPTMLVGIKSIDVIAREPDLDLLHDL